MQDAKLGEQLSILDSARKEKIRCFKSRNSDSWSYDWGKKFLNDGVMSCVQVFKRDHVCL